MIVPTSAAFAAAGFHATASRLQFGRHGVERSHQFTQFVSRGDLHAVVVAPARNLLRGLGQCLHRPGHRLGYEQCQPSGCEKRHHRQQKQQLGISAAELFTLQAQLVIGVLAGVNAGQGLAEF